MSLYSGPSKERSVYTSKFVRVEKNIFVTKPGDVNTSHFSLAEKNDIYEKVRHMRFLNPDEVDGGFFLVAKNMIYIRGCSLSLELPVTEQARERTIEEFILKSQDYIVGERR